MHILIEDEHKNIRSTDVSDDVDCVFIGSNPDGHVYLPDVRIADEHFWIRRRDGNAWWLECCKIPPDTPAEYTRLYVNAVEAIDSIEVKHNDEIVISRFRLRVFVDDANSNAPRAAVMEDASKIRAHPLPSGSLVLSDPFAGAVLPPGSVAPLADFAFEIHECVTLASLMTTAISGVMLRFDARQVWMGGRRHGYGRLEFIETRLSDGGTSGDPPRLKTFEYRCGERGQLICCSQTEEPETESILCVPLIAAHGILGMLYVDNKADDRPYGEQDLDILRVMGILVAKQLDLVVRDQLKLQEAITVGELSFMRELQSKMDPTTVAQWDGLQLAVYCKPGLDSAGDIYDVMRLPNGLASFICGHVTGLPTHAALAMAEIRASFRMAGLHADPPHILMRALNWLIHDAKNPTALCVVSVVMNPNTGAMQFATAGEIGAAIIDPQGHLRSLVQPTVPEVGTVRDFVYNSNAGCLQEGETLILYSPGCFSATDKNGESLGKGRFTEALSDGFGQTASAALDELLSDLGAFFKEGRQPDDITIMVLHHE